MRMTSEQPTSAHEMLRQAGVRHGDTTEVVVATGAKVVESESGQPTVHAMFCSGVARTGNILKKGGFFERRKPIKGDIEINASNNNPLTLTPGTRCVALLRGTVFTNGHVEFDFNDVTLVPVADTGNLHNSNGRDVCGRVLEEALAS